MIVNDASKCYQDLLVRVGEFPFEGNEGIDEEGFGAMPQIAVALKENRQAILGDLKESEDRTTLVAAVYVELTQFFMYRNNFDLNHISESHSRYSRLLLQTLTGMDSASRGKSSATAMRAKVDELG
jgi:hypothetical protein